MVTNYEDVSQVSFNNFLLLKNIHYAPDTIIFAGQRHHLYTNEKNIS